MDLGKNLDFCRVFLKNFILFFKGVASPWRVIRFRVQFARWRIVSWIWAAHKFELAGGGKGDNLKKY